MLHSSYYGNQPLVKHLPSSPSIPFTVFVASMDGNAFTVKHFAQNEIVALMFGVVPILYSMVVWMLGKGSAEDVA